MIKLFLAKSLKGAEIDIDINHDFDNNILEIFILLITLNINEQIIKITVKLLLMVQNLKIFSRTKIWYYSEYFISLSGFYRFN